MKLLAAFLIMVPSVGVAAQFSTPSRVKGTQHLFRGAQPIGQVQKLRAAGVDEVVIFKNDLHGEVEQEIKELKESDYSLSDIHHVPMEWKQINIPHACEQTIEALNILIKAEQEARNIYVHCTAGEDRTGMIAGLARMLLTHEKTEAVFENELCENNYSDGNPHKPRAVTAAIEQGLTPLFFAIANKIESGDLTSETLTPSICADLVVNSESRRCH